MELNEKIESYIDEFYVLYKYDVKSIFKSMNKDISTKEKMKKLDDKQINEYIKGTSNDDNLDAFVHELVKQLSNTYRFFMYDWDMEKIYLKDKKTTQVLLLSDLLTSLLKNK